jgi:hypothetical protein
MMGVGERELRHRDFQPMQAGKMRDCLITIEKTGESPEEK